MIVDKVLGNIHEKKPEKTLVMVSFEWFETEKYRQIKEAKDGTMIGLHVSKGIRDGDIIAETKKKAYIAEIVPAKVIKIPISSLEEMGRVCFELGNRHLPVKIADRCITVPHDDPTFLHLLKHGFRIEIVSEKFADYLQCRGHKV